MAEYHAWERHVAGSTIAADLEILARYLRPGGRARGTILPPRSAAGIADFHASSVLEVAAEGSAADLRVILDGRLDWCAR